MLPPLYFDPQDQITMPEKTEYVERRVSFARTGVVGPTGTLISELKTKVDPDTDIAFRRLVVDNGTDVAGALRDYVYLMVHGKTYTSMLADDAKVKHDRFFGKGLIEALKREAA